MKIIKRFDLEVEPSQNVQIQMNAEVVHFNVFNKKPAIWAIVDDGSKLIDRTFKMFTDLAEIPAFVNRTKYVGSFQHKAEVGQHTVHVFEE